MEGVFIANSRNTNPRYYEILLYEGVDSSSTTGGRALSHTRRTLEECADCQRTAGIAGINNLP